MKIKLIACLVALSSLSALAMENNEQLFRAVENNDYAATRSLLEQGVSPNIVELFKWSPLHTAASDGHLNILTLLIQKGADINARTTYNYTPLHHAVGNKNIKATEELVKNKADISACGDNGDNPLHTAARNSDIEIIKLLLACGANVNAQNTQTEQTPLHLVVDDDCWHADKSLPAVQELIKHGALINMRDCRGYIPLHYAIINHKVDVVKELIAHKAHVKALTDCGESPLYLAQKTYKKSLIQLVEQALSKS